MSTFKYIIESFTSLSLLSLIAIATPRLQAGTPDNSFRVQQEWKLAGDGGWDHLTVDSKNHYLYVTRSTRVTVVDTATGKPVAEIPGFKNAHSVSLDESGKVGFILDGAASSIRVFDRSTLETVASIAVGGNPTSAVLDPATGLLLVFDGRGKDATFIDPGSNRQVSEIALQGRPVSAVVDGNGFVFAALEDTQKVVRIDARSHQASAEWSVPSCSELTGLAIDTTNRRLFSVCDFKKLVMLDSGSGKVLATVRVAEGTREISYDPRRNLVFGANGGGILSVVKEDAGGQLSVVQTVKTQTGASSLAIDPTSGSVYLPAAQFGLRTGDVSEELRFRPTPIPGSFVVLVVAN